MALPKIRYLTARARANDSQRWVWQPGPRLRREGWRAVVLKDAAGAHSDLPTAIGQANWLNAVLDCMVPADDRLTAAALLDCWRNGDDPARFHGRFPDLRHCPFAPYDVPGLAGAEQHAEPPRRSLARLIEIYQADTSWFLSLGARTQEGYRSNLRLLPAEMKNWPVSEIKRGRLRQIYRALHEAGGVHVANGRFRALSAVLSYAVELEWIPANPLHKFRMAIAPGRVRIATDDELAHMVAIADAAAAAARNTGERLEAALMVAAADAAILARWCGQRRSDLVKIREDQDHGTNLQIRQGKTGMVVRIEIVPVLRERLDLARQRNRAAHGDLAARLAERRLKDPGNKTYAAFGSGAALLINPKTGLPWPAGALTRAFRALRERAAETMPSLEDLRLADLRDTFVTYLVRKEFTLFEICALTGHTPDSVQMICRAYVELSDDALSKRAGQKLLASIREG